MTTDNLIIDFVALFFLLKSFTIFLLFSIYFRYSTCLSAISHSFSSTFFKRVIDGLASIDVMNEIIKRNKRYMNKKKNNKWLRTTSIYTHWRQSISTSIQISGHISTTTASHSFILIKKKSPFIGNFAKKFDDTNRSQYVNEKNEMKKRREKKKKILNCNCNFVAHPCGVIFCKQFITGFLYKCKYNTREINFERQKRKIEENNEKQQKSVFYRSFFFFSF